MFSAADARVLCNEADVIGDAVSRLYQRGYTREQVERTTLYREWCEALQRSGRALIERDAKQEGL